MKLAHLLTAVLLSTATSVGAATYFESTLGDLSNDPAMPTPIDLAQFNQVDGTVIAGNRDFFTIRVPVGRELSALTFDKFESTNTRAFLGMTAGDVFTVDPNNPNPTLLLGYVHFGLDYVIGDDLLDDLSHAPGTIGFARPLPAGAYSFWVNQTEPVPVGYAFSFVTTAVPEPTAIGLMVLAGFMGPRWRK